MSAEAPPTLSIWAASQWMKRDCEFGLRPAEKIVDLGSKKTYLYKDGMKITFTDGRVSDISGAVTSVGSRQWGWVTAKFMVHKGST